MNTRIGEPLEPALDDQAAAQERIIESLTAGQYDGMAGSLRDAYDTVRSWYGRGLRDAAQEDILQPMRNTARGAAVERKLRAAGMDTAPYDYLQVRITPDREELRLLGEGSRTIPLPEVGVAGQVYDSVRNAGDRSVSRVLEEVLVRTAMRREIRAARAVQQESDATPGVTRTYVFPRDR